MTSKFLKITVAVLLPAFVSSCKMYYMPVGGFLEQVPSIETVEFKKVTVKDPWGHLKSYGIYPIDSIKCFDKDGTPHKLKNGPSIEIRFTDNNNKRTTFYFDKVWLIQDTIVGETSRFLLLKKKIAVNTIKKIEIQDGHKKYKYVN